MTRAHKTTGDAMQTSKFLKVTGLIATLLLGGCRSVFEIDTYSSDLFVDKNIDTPAQMKVEIPTCTDRSEYENKIIALFDAGSRAKIVGCEEQGMSSMLVVSIAVEMASETSSRDLILFREKAPDLEHDGRVYEVRGIKPVFSSSFIQRVNSLMEQNLQKFSYDNLSIQFGVNNDESGDILISGNTLWVDGNPYQRFHRQPLARRQKFDMRLSDVMSDLVIKGKMPIAFWVLRTK